MQAVSHHLNPSRRWEKRGRERVCVPPGGGWTRQDLTDSPLLKRGYLFETRHLTCAYVSSVESTMWKTEKGTHKSERKGVKNVVLNSRKSLIRLPHSQRTESWEIIQPLRPCLFPLLLYFSSLLSYLSLTRNLALHRVTVCLAINTHTFEQNPHNRSSTVGVRRTWGEL